MKRICILGSNSGRNAGDAAILSSIVMNIRRRCPGASFEVPVPRKRDLYSRFDPSVARAVPMMPWNLSLRFVGLPTLASIARSDIVLITDGIIFDLKLFNPLFNFLIQLVAIVPFARLLRKKVVCLLVGVGPLRSRCGRLFARLVGNMCDSVLVREEHSAALMRDIGVAPERISVYADAALVDEPAPRERAEAILRENGLDPAEGVVGLNLNAYFGRWLGQASDGLDAEGFASELARGVDAVIDATGCRLALVLTQVMDVRFAREVLDRAARRDRVAVLACDRYSAEELMAAIGLMRVFAGMRLHSLILAAAMDTPCIGLAYAPKVTHFMELMGFPELTLELTELKAERLAAAYRRVLEGEDEIRPKFAARSAELRRKAAQGFDRFCADYLGAAS